MKLLPNKRTGIIPLIVIIGYIMFILLIMFPDFTNFGQWGQLTHNKKIYDKIATFTAYNLEESQTDSTPDYGAWDDNLREHRGCVIATRLYGRHTILDIEGIGRCEVLYKTSRKYSSRIDLLLPTRAEANKFGKKTLHYKIINQ